MVRELCVPPLGCHCGRGCALTRIERTPSASRLSASIIPTGPPPMMMIGAVIRSDRQSSLRQSDDFSNTFIRNRLKCSSCWTADLSSPAFISRLGSLRPTKREQTWMWSS